MNYCQLPRSRVLSIIFPLNNPYRYKSFCGRGCQMERQGSTDSSGLCGFHIQPIISLLWLSCVLFLNLAAEGIAYSMVEHAREGAFHLRGAVKVLAL